LATDPWQLSTFLKFVKHLQSIKKWMKVPREREREIASIMKGVTRIADEIVIREIQETRGTLETHVIQEIIPARMMIAEENIVTMRLIQKN